jgi:dephospho-CoA kinase
MHGMLYVGLTGGIGAGKSTVARQLASLGAAVIEADQVAREVVAPGTPLLAAIVNHFGAKMLLADGSLDRTQLGNLVFANPTALADLERLTHPAIEARTAELIAQVPRDEVIVHDVPLLIEKGMSANYHLVIAVLAEESVRLRRLVALRGMNIDDVRARMATQASDTVRHRTADILIDNSGSAEVLRQQVEHLWRDRLDPYDDNLCTLTRAKRPQYPPVPIIDYQPDWPDQAERLSARLRRALSAVRGCDAAIIEHIGSTAVPGLAAKNVIDLQLSLSSLNLADLPEFEQALNAVGYVQTAGNVEDNTKDGTPWPKRFYGSMDPGQFVHLHVRVTGSPNATFAIAFREWLRAHPGECAEYTTLKRALVESALDTTTYANSKEPWFDAVYPRVMEWWKTR